MGRSGGTSQKNAGEGRIVIVPPIHGKITRDGKVSEPDIYWILERWFERHPDVDRREDVRITRGRTMTSDGLKTDLIQVTILDKGDLAEYIPEVDQDLYAYYLAEPQLDG